MTTFVLRYWLDGKDEKTHEYSFLVTPGEMAKTHIVHIKSDDPYDGFDDGYTTSYSIRLNFTDYDPNKSLNDIKSITLSQEYDSTSEYSEEYAIQKKFQDTLEQLVKENNELGIVLKYEKYNRNENSAMREREISDRISTNMKEIDDIKNRTCEINYIVEYKTKCFILPRNTQGTMDTLFKFYRFSTSESGKVNFYWHFINTSGLSPSLSNHSVYNSEPILTTITKSRKEKKIKTISALSSSQKRKYM